MFESKNFQLFERNVEKMTFPVWTPLATSSDRTSYSKNLCIMSNDPYEHQSSWNSNNVTKVVIVKLNRIIC